MGWENLVKKFENSKGFVLIPALYIIVIIAIVGATFYAYVKAQQKPVMHEQASITAKYVAETGFQKIITELASSANLTTHPILTNPTRTSNPQSLATDVSGSRSVEKYYIAKIENGDILSSLGTTVTGSTVAGRDKYNNPIWFDTTNKNFDTKRNAHRFGIELRGYVEEKSGDKTIKKTGQGVYAVVEIPAPVAGSNELKDPPAGYLLASDADLSLLSSAQWYGPIHSNKQLQFTWLGSFNPDDFGDVTKTYTRGSPANTAEIITYPPLVVKQSSTTYIAGTDYMLSYGTNGWYIDWSPAGAEPSCNSSYTITHGYDDPLSGQGITTTLVRNCSSTADAFLQSSHVTGPSDVPISFSVKQGITYYSVGTDYTLNYTSGTWNIDWSSTTGIEPAGGSSYTILYDSGLTDTVIRGATPLDPFTFSVEQGAITYAYETNYRLLPIGNNWYLHWEPASRPCGGYIIRHGNGTTSFTEECYDKLLPKVSQNTTKYSINSDYYLMPWGNPQQWYLYWYPPTGNEPVVGSQYTTTYLPHDSIGIYGPLSYSGSTPAFKYYHEHRATTGSWPTYRGNHGHTDVWGAAFATNNTGSDYLPWPSKRHYHTISTDLTNSPPNPDTYFIWGDNSYKPVSAAVKNPPVVSPNNVNYYRQREQLNRYMQIMFKTSMPRDTAGNLGLPSPAPTSCCPVTFPSPCPGGACPPANPVSCAEQGYFDMAGGVKDFRCYYFGNNLKYSAGSQDGQQVPFCYYSTPPVIWVNDNKNSTDFMKVANSQVNSDYHYYTYFEIPKNRDILDTKGTGVSVQSGLIVVKDGIIKLGNYKPKDPAINCTDCITTTTAGNGTIIDGRLTIVSYTEQKPTNYNVYNKGDIIIIGNIWYRNGLYTNDYISWREYTPPGARPTSPTDPNITWLTNKDGSIVTTTDSAGRVQPKGLISGLGLIAVNDVKFPTAPYWATDISGNDKTDDAPEIDAQIIAGHSFSQFQTTSNKSNRDKFYFYGSIYSYLAPQFDYFQINRYYFLDKSLFIVPLLGEPFFPKDDTYKSQHIAGTTITEILPGTWKTIPAP